MEKNNDKAEVAILLSSYNGEKYIAEQIDSIMNQTYENWILCIRDDGSKDSTIDILRYYEKKDKRIKILTDEIKHRGVKNSFLWLLQNTESDYYMFCDQDDVWDSQKVKISYDNLKTLNDNVPSVVCTDLLLVNQNLEVINKSMWETHHLSRLVDYKKGLLIASMFPGCTMMFNNAAKEIALNEDFEFPLHDLQISLSTYKSNGNIIPIHNSLIKYRQHSNNVVGLYSGNRWLINKITNIQINVNQIAKYYCIVHNYLNVSFPRFVYLKILHYLNII